MGNTYTAIICCYVLVMYDMNHISCENVMMWEFECFLDYVIVHTVLSLETWERN